MAAVMVFLGTSLVVVLGAGILPIWSDTDGYLVFLSAPAGGALAGAMAAIAVRSRSDPWVPGAAAIGGMGVGVALALVCYLAEGLLSGAWWFWAGILALLTFAPAVAGAMAGLMAVWLWGLLVRPAGTVTRRDR